MNYKKAYLLDNSIKKNQTDVASAWSSYQSNQSLLNSVRAQVDAAEIANEGIVAEYNSGSDRTTLEVIQSNSLLLNAQISLADSEKNYILSQFNLLKSIGLLNSDYLKIKIIYWFFNSKNKLILLMRTKCVHLFYDSSVKKSKKRGKK